MVNPVDVKNNNRFNLENSKLILKEEVNSLSKVSLFGEGKELYSIYEFLVKLGKVTLITNHIFINILITSILIKIFKGDKISKVINNIDYKFYLCLIFFTEIKLDDFHIARFMIAINKDSKLLFYCFKGIKLGQIFLQTKLTQFKQLILNDCLFIYLIQGKGLSILRDVWCLGIKFGDEFYVWKYPNLNKIELMIIISLIMYLLYGINQYFFKKVYFNNKYKLTDLMFSIGGSLALWIMLIMKIN